MYDLQTTDWLREIQEYLPGGKVTVEDALGNKLYFGLLDIEVQISDQPIQEVTIHAYYTGKEPSSKKANDNTNIYNTGANFEIGTPRR